MTTEEKRGKGCEEVASGGLGCGDDEQRDKEGEGKGYGTEEGGDGFEWVGASEETERETEDGEKAEVGVGGEQNGKE